MKNKLFHYRLFKLANINAMFMRNHGRPLLGIIARLFPAMGGRLSKPRFANCKAFLLAINLIAKRQGIRGAVMHLKVSGVAVQQAIAGHVLKDLTPLGPRVARDGKGLPRLLPLSWRVEIHKGNTSTMILSLTLISLFRVLTFPANAKLSTITDPFKGNLASLYSMKVHVPTYVKMILKPLSRRGMDAFEWVKGKTIPFPILTSSPTSVSRDDEISSSPKSVWRAMYSFVQRNVIQTGTSDPGEGSLYHSLLQILDLGSNFRSYFNQIDDSILYLHQPLNGGWHWFPGGSMANWAKMLGAKIFATGVRFSPYENGSGRNTGKPWSLGKLGFHDEAAGKVRVFAMVDPWTQWALAPIHKLLFKLLRAIPMDGTFDQLKPIKRLLARKPKVLDSLDLSAATDRLPILLQEWIIASLFNPSIAKAWSTLLVGRDYRVPKRDDQTTALPKMVTYAVGQPMGALSSWAMLAITHHFTVQLAAWQAGVTRYGWWFTDYALLGDDLTVGNRAVSLRYQRIMKHLGVEIGLAKSILSDKAIGLEFAKKTFYKGVNVSPRPIKELLGALLSPASLVSYAKRYNLSDAEMFKVAGFGYRVLGGLNKPLGKQSTSVRFTLITRNLPSSVSELKQTYESMRAWFKTHDMVGWLYQFIASEALVLHRKLRSMEDKVGIIYSSYSPKYFKGAWPGASTWDLPVKWQIWQTLSDISRAVTFDYSYRMRVGLSKVRRDALKIAGSHRVTELTVFVGEVNDKDVSSDLYYIYLNSLTEASKWSLDAMKLVRPEEKEGVNLQISRFFNAFNGFLRKIIGKQRDPGHPGK
ncbi:RNA-dependent RNA polymerase [Duamitovirus hepa3]|uniref:RNA-dependent RNA polymerase n=1 Tax=Heterobasidion mitovirus 3 TaxID=2603543 RepID=A0ABX5YEU6_9VIRU|nr:RNA-dependent RNA polymerase [Heterobasidion mitovirus 3]QED55412.1 RNA-dependent RNA polymerase [Heterobasidion mitovirus 3]